ncbi:hypothetical protein RchiOBHm_Chr3g0475281 [Rosa chinensis]|uniref:Uncharacterized protein n=1 Tax=Rosa chinensis TaxID=74649 RepID=A0A2P6RCB4_ROSCH|nr:hypothetical protein RchiOBHm_Chr3g0475281 [Rosa chinensis]
MLSRLIGGGAVVDISEQVWATYELWGMLWYMCCTRAGMEWIGFVKKEDVWLRRMDPFLSKDS